jgi:hypothetical protein
LLTSEHPEPHVVLSETSTTTPSDLSQGMTETERDILYKLLIDLFLDHPQTPQGKPEERGNSHESVSAN